MKKPELVNDWKSSWRWFSMNFMALAASLQVTYLTLPEDMKSSIPSNVIQVLTTFLLVAGMIGNVIKQPVKAVKKENDDIGV